MAAELKVRRSSLILGGARSGKSAFAQLRAEASSRRLIYVATAASGDDEMTARIAGHVAARGSRWETVEELTDLEEVIGHWAAAPNLLLVDCLTLWLANVFERGEITGTLQRLATAIEAAAADLILVSNELGLGLVPDNAMSRRFRDLHGQMNQLIAAVCDDVVLVAAGLPVCLKGSL